MDGFAGPAVTLAAPAAAGAADAAVAGVPYDGVRAGYRGRRVHPVSGAQSLTLDPREMLARLCQHIPPPGLHLTRLYGAYANRTRGARDRLGAAAGERPSPGKGASETPTLSQRERRREWAKLIARVFEVHPLRRDHAGRRVHPRPHGDPQDSAAPAAA